MFIVKYVLNLKVINSIKYINVSKIEFLYKEINI